MNNNNGQTRNANGENLCFALHSYNRATKKHSKWILLYRNGKQNTLIWKKKRHMKEYCQMKKYPQGSENVWHFAVMELKRLLLASNWSKLCLFIFTIAMLPFFILNLLFNTDTRSAIWAGDPIKPKTSAQDSRLLWTYSLNECVQTEFAVGAECNWEFLELTSMQKTMLTKG